MSTVSAPASPFKGLAPFDDTALDAILFFGRVREIEVIAANLQASRLTVLYGPTGVGKSSVLRAGAAQRLRTEPDVAVEIVDTWSVDAASVVRSALAARPDDGDLYLILDQFEEYFVYHGEDPALPRLLGEVVGERGLRANVLIGIREDALARLDAFRAPVPNLLANRLRLERLDRDAARAAILGPVARYNELSGEAVDVEPELVETVLDEVAAGRVELARGGRGAVDGAIEDHRIEAPYLQLVLERLWAAEREAGSRRLRVETLRRLGGSARIVHEHLERAMAALTADEQDTAAEMYRYLVTPGGTKIAHRIGDLAGYASVGEHDAAAVLDKLVRERIVRASSDNGPASTRYEIYHDVLANAVLTWRERHAEARALAESEEKRRRAHRLAAVALAGLIVVAAVAVFALVERGRARSQARRARAEELAARATTLLGTDPATALQVAADAARLRQSPREEEVLRSALTADRLRATLRARGPVTAVGFSPDNRLLLSGSADGNVRIYRRGSSTPLHVLRQAGVVTAASFDTAGRRILTGGRDGTAKIWDVRSGRELQALSVGGPAAAASWTRGGGIVITASRGGLVRVWRSRDGRRVRSFQTVPRVERAVVDPAGRLVVVVRRDRFARVYSLLTGRRIRSIPHQGFVGAVVFSPNGRLLLTADYSGTVRLWDARSGKLLRRLLGGQRNIPAAVFSGDGSRIAAVSADATARIWDVATGLQLAVAIGRNPLTAVAFSHDGTAVVATSTDGTARVWGAVPANGGRLITVLSGHRGPIVAAAFSPDGRAVITGSDDGTARLWDPGSEPDFALTARRRVALTALAVGADRRRVLVGGDDGVAQVRSTDGRRVVRTLRANGAVTAVAFGPDGPEAAHAPTTAVAYSPNGAVKAVAVGDAVRVGSRTVRPNGGAVHDLAFSPDGRDLAIALDNGTAELRDSATGRPSVILRGHTAPVLAIAFQPKGSLVATASNHDVWLWNRQTGHVTRKLQGPVVRDVQWSPDGRWIVAAGSTTAAIWKVNETTGVPGLLHAPVRRPFSAVAFGGNDGKVIFAASLDGTLRTYHCSWCGDVHELLMLATRRMSGRS